MLKRTEILKLAANRMIAGSREHGRWDPKTNQLNLYDEITEELLDVINYSVMQIQKISVIKIKMAEAIKKGKNIW